MKNKSSNKMEVAIAVSLLVLVIAAQLVTLPLVDAHTPAWQVPTYIYINVAPNPVGVGQTTTIVFWLNWPPPSAAGTGGDRWQNINIDVTRPDGTKQTLGPFTLDSVGSMYALYTPDTVGTYNFKIKFPGQVAELSGYTGIPGIASAYINDTFLPSSAETTLTVQQTPVTSIPDYPLPTEYWSRPIEGENTIWSTIASNWLGGSHIIGKFQCDGIAPGSAHIMWTKPISFGGIVGGSKTGIQSATFYSGLSYEAKFTNPIIMYGRLYYNLPKSDAATGNGYVCVDLQTGEEIYWQNMTAPTFGQLYDYESMNQHGVIPNGYLWRTVNDAKNGGTVWIAYDAYDGNWLFNETNVPSGTTVYGPNGEILIYQMNSAKGWLALWNNTAAANLVLTPGTTSNAYQWRPIGKNVNASEAYSWNVTLPSLKGSANPSIVTAITDDILFGISCTWAARPAIGTSDPFTMWAISLKPDSRGSLLWLKNYPAPQDNITINQGFTDPVNRIFTLYYKETMQWVAYSLDTGEKLWGPTEPEPDWNYYNYAAIGEFVTTAYGNLYVGGYSGELRCYDTRSGNVQWIYNNTLSGLDNPYGHYPLSIAGIADGKIYLYTSEHSPNVPPYKGARIRCVDAFTGEELWTTLGWSSGGASSAYAIADGYFVYLNLYDMQIYCYGKGKSATTVQGPDTVVPFGTGVLIKGTVTDQTPQIKDTSAISDADNDEWMEYLYMQKPKPTDAVGVSVKLTATDLNGNSQDIGTVTTDINGNYAITWTPQTKGMYHITATFQGTNSYYGSSQTTYITVGEASESVLPTETTTPTPATPTSEVTASPTFSPTASPSPVIENPSSFQTETLLIIGAAIVIIAVIATAAIFLRKHQ